MSALLWVLFGPLFLVATLAPIWTQMVVTRYGWTGDLPKASPGVADKIVRRRRQRF